MGFCKDFVWGAATSAYQIEGAAAKDGKGMSVWDVFTKEPGRIYGGHNGDIACDHYARFQEDVEIMAAMGLKAYRFSLSWPRILPEGYGRVNEAGIAFYNRLIDALLEKGITPYITLYHWDLPYELYKRGGWMNPDIVEWFGEYARLAAERFSDRVRHFITLNEPQCFIGLGFVTGEHAPGLKAPLRDSFQMAHNALKSHGRAVQALRQYGRQPLLIGYAPTCSVPCPATESPKDIRAAKEALFSMPENAPNWAWNVTWQSDPVFLGHYPEDGRKRYEAYLPPIADGDMALISQPIDFYGQNIYSGKYVRMGADGRPEETAPVAGFPKTAMDWNILPECLYWGPRFLYERYRTPICITENGISCPDAVSLDGQVHDPGRIDFLERHIRQLEAAAEDGVDIRGYFHWSLLDNFEWAAGYSQRFGLIYVDYQTQRRIWKDSAYWYRDLIGRMK